MQFFLEFRQICILLIISNNYSKIELWLILKLLLIFVMSGVHGYYSYCHKLFLQRTNKYTPKYYRYINEIPTILLIFIVFLAIFKPTY